MAGRRVNPRITNSFKKESENKDSIVREDNSTQSGRNFWSCLESEELEEIQDPNTEAKNDRNWKSEIDSERKDDTQKKFESKSRSDCVEISIKQTVNSHLDPTKISVELKRELMKNEYQRLVEMKVVMEWTSDHKNHKPISESTLKVTDHGHQEATTSNNDPSTSVHRTNSRNRSKQRKRRCDASKRRRKQRKLRKQI